MRLYGRLWVARPRPPSSSVEVPEAGFSEIFGSQGQPLDQARPPRCGFTAGLRACCCRSQCAPPVVRQAPRPRKSLDARTIQHLIGDRESS